MSGLRCRVGDLAIVVSTLPEHRWGLGRIVRVIELMPPDGDPLGPCWRMEQPVQAPTGESYTCVFDSALRPIRPDADEPATETEREKEAA